MTMNRSIVRSVGLALLVLASASIYFAGQRHNPPGFYADESSIAYNALTISRHGVDEHGIRMPLYFEAFGEYKNPTYIYVLSGVFKIFAPSNLVARRLSALAGYLACVVLGLLAWRITGSAFVAVATFLTGLLTPMLFEVSRLVFEVALYPLIIALFLYAARVASERTRWNPALIVALVLALAAITYTYSIGRLLGALFAVSLLIFWTPERRSQIIAVIAGYVVVVALPIALFNARHNGALTSHFQTMTYVDARAPVKTLIGFERHYVENLLPLGFAFAGDPNPRHHVPESGGSILLMTFLLATMAIVRGLSSAPRDRWLWFLICGAAISVIPASMTIDVYHTLRLIALPLFLITLSISILPRRSAAVAVLLAIGIAQAAFFFIEFHRHGAPRRLFFEAGAPQVIHAALKTGAHPIYIEEGTLYAHAYWYGTLAGVDPSRFSRQTDNRPRGSVVISEREPPPGVSMISRSENYSAYQLP